MSRAYHYVLTLQAPLPGGSQFIASFSSVISLPTGTTRVDAMRAVMEEVVRENQPDTRAKLHLGSVLYFSIDPNTLGGGR